MKISSNRPAKVRSSYSAPLSEIVEIRIESGFALSQTSGNNENMLEEDEVDPWA